MSLTYILCSHIYDLALAKVFHDCCLREEGSTFGDSGGPFQSPGFMTTLKNTLGAQMAESTQTHYHSAVGQPQSSCLTGTNPSVTLLKANISWELQSSANPVCDEQSFLGHFEWKTFFHQHPPNSSLPRRDPGCTNPSYGQNSPKRSLVECFLFETKLGSVIYCTLARENRHNHRSFPSESHSQG